MSASDHLSGQFKPKRKVTLSYQYNDKGVTMCPKCHKNEIEREKQGKGHLKPSTADITVKYNTDFGPGDLETCSGGCGRTIYGRKGTYE
jgi:hypothetical protein